MSASERATVRRDEAARLSHLMEAQRPFSYVRLGDGEQRYLRQLANGITDLYEASNSRENTSLDTHANMRSFGVRPEFYERLKRSFERASYLDLYDHYQGREHQLAGLKLDLPPAQTTNPIPETAQIFFDWTQQHFASFISGKRVLIASAESPLLERLYANSAYRTIAKSYWPAEGEVFFYRFPEDGFKFWENLDSIKAELAATIRRERIDALFVSVSWGAKILGVELAEEENIVTFDLGSLTCGLAYAATPGFSIQRRSHFPYFFRVPLDVYAAAMMEAYPYLSGDQMLRKIQAQLCLDLYEKKSGNSVGFMTAERSSFDPRPEDLAAFRESHNYYKHTLLPILRKEHGPISEALVRDFEQWRRVRGVGWDGKVFRAALAVKKSVSQKA